MKKITSNLVVALLGGLISVGIFKVTEQEKYYESEDNKKKSNKFVNIINATPDASIDYVSAAELTVNGVVHVKTEGTVEYKQQGFDPLRQFLYGNGNVERQTNRPIKGAGSGVIISEEGYMVTNNHVIDNADVIKVTLNNQKTYVAELVGTDPTTDLAVLKIEEEGLPYLSYGNSDDLRIGEWVLAVGNPFNLTSTVTAGIVSAKSRDIDLLENDPFTGLNSIESFIQTDAAVNPGNSGGALVNTHGELIGINAAIKSNTGSFAGYSFAIPSNIVKKVVDDIIEFGIVQRAFIGINIQNINDDIAEKHNLDSRSGVYIAGISETGSAKEAGIKEGDIVTHINNLNVDNVTQLQAKIGEYRPGDKIEVKLKREGQIVTKSLTLRNLEGNTKITKDSENQLAKQLGAKFEELNIEETKKLKIEGGIKLAELYAGKLKSAGMMEGFIITQVGDEKVKSIPDFFKLIKNKNGGILIQGKYLNGRESYYAFGM
jgi:Do/DeqQ family serine protease